MAEKECEGKCPYCGSDNIDFIEVIESDFEWMSEGWHCITCDRNFEIIYDIVTTYGVTQYEEIPLDEQNLWENKNNKED